FWVANNGSGTSTLYNTQGTPQSLRVSIPAPGAPLGNDGSPTGVVFNINGGGTGGFKLNGFAKNGTPTSEPALFLFATENGTIIGWNPGVNPSGFDPTKAGTYGIIAVDNSTIPNAANGAVYKGLAIAQVPVAINTGGFLLYVTNFRSGKVEVYDNQFKP